MLTIQMWSPRRFRKCFGGGIRQSGGLAAAADFALTHNFNKLKEAHARAKELSAGFKEMGVRVTVEAETNMVRASFTLNLESRARRLTKSFLLLPPGLL